MNDSSPGGFLRRWSSRKSEARSEKTPALDRADEKALPGPPDVAPPPVVNASNVKTPSAPSPTLEEAAQLTPESDFSAFARQEVPQDVKNVAMKKLFADPHFNVMDGLDIYIDDYSQPDPLAPALLRQMASAQFLNLVDAPPSDSPTSPDDAAQSDTVRESVAQCATLCSPSDPANHDHADLRLQPDPGAGSQDTGAEPV